MKIKSRNVWKTDTTSNTTSFCLLNKPTTYRQHSRRRRRFNCIIMRKKLTPIFRQISDAATPKLVKRMAGMSPVHSLLDKLLEGSRRRIQAASLACCSSWNIVFHELILPLTELRHIPPFTGPVWATQMVSSVPLYAGVAPSWWSLCVPGSWWPDGFWPFSQWCWILEILLSRKKILRNLIWLTGCGLIPTTE